MAWLEVSVRVIPEAAEAVAEVLSRYAPQGVAIDMGEGDTPVPVTVKAYLPADEELEARRRRVAEGLWHLKQIWDVIPDPTFTPVADEDWTAKWKERIPVLHLGERVVIKPSWRQYQAQPSEVVLEMDPGLAFGTGLHPTTQLCVAALESQIYPGARVLDLGTGTGILAMVAARLGAGEVLAVDIDENAIIATRRNLQNNALASAVRVFHGSLEQVPGTYDVILANILAPVIILLAGGLAEHLRTGGALVASGILEEQEAEVRVALGQHGLRVVQRHQQEEWLALVAKHAYSPRPGR